MNHAATEEIRRVLLLTDGQRSVVKVGRRTEPSDAPGWQGATTENTRCI